MSDVKRLLDRIERGERTIDALCDGKLRWVMNVPAEPDRDPDLVLSDALAAGKEAISALPDYEAAVDALERVLETEYTLQVSGHDVECDVVQTSGRPCSCGFTAAREDAATVLRRLREEVPA